jgi:hypothetical protein
VRKTIIFTLNQIGGEEPDSEGPLPYIKDAMSVNASIKTLWPPNKVAHIHPGR